MIPLPVSQKWRILHYSWIAFWTTFLAWFAFAPVAVLVQKDLGLTNAQLGWLAMAGQVLTIPGRLVIGGLVDRYGPRRVFPALLMLTAVPVALLGLASSFPELFFLRLLIGLTGCGFVIGVRLVADWFPPRQLGLAEGIYGGWGNCGAGFGAFLLPLIALAWGWRWALALAAVPMVLWAFFFWRGVSDVPAGRVFRRTPRECRVPVWRDSNARILAFAYLATFGTEISLVTFLPKYFYDRFSVSATQAGACAAIFAILNVVARPAGGWLADVYGRHRVLLITLAGTAFGYAAMGLASSLPAAIAATILAGLLVQAGCGAVYALAPAVSPTGVGQVAGFIGAVANAGALVFPLIFGYTLQWTGGSYGPSFAVVALTASMALVLAWRLRLSPNTWHSDSAHAAADQHQRGLKVSMQPYRTPQYGDTAKPLNSGA